MKYIIVTGISGAGKTTVLNTLEDLGYHCVDNMPVDLIPKFTAIMDNNSAGINKVAIGLDARNAFGFHAFQMAKESIKSTGAQYKAIFVDCADQVIISRYKQTRRRHPLMSSKKLSLSEAIREDRRLMSEVREETDIIVDTANISSAQLRSRITACVDEKSKMSVTVMSFGFKYGIPADADLVFDVRCFANPYYVESMKHHTGMEDEVYNFVFSFDEVHEFVKKLFDMLDFLLPLYEKEGKAQLSVAIGCTGGKHRSVAITKAVSEKLCEKGLNCVEIHRDMER